MGVGVNMANFSVPYFLNDPIEIEASGEMFCQPRPLERILPATPFEAKMALPNAPRWIRHWEGQIKKGHMATPINGQNSKRFKSIPNQPHTVFGWELKIIDVRVYLKSC